jgi:diadenosine tetraphosphatase ApaH/serine/threonine PP2A family protein phosphatase
MRALILSDIHANYEALHAVLDAAPEHDTVWNLGDIVGYGASPNEVIEGVRGLGNLFVRGNHDRACSGLSGLEDFNPIAGRAARWTQAILSAGHTEWLREIPSGPIVPGDQPVTCSHGSLLDEDEYVMTVRDAWGPLQRTEARVNFFGHTHLQGGFATNGSEWFRLSPQYGSRNGVTHFKLTLRDDGRYLINPGSVGQPRDGDWRASFAVYDNVQRIVTFWRVPYDVALAQEKILNAGLPERLAIRLREGR